MPTAIRMGGPTRIQDMDDYGSPLTWAGQHIFQGKVGIGTSPVYLLDLNPGAGDGLRIQGTRPLILMGTGTITWQGSAGGWVNAFQAKGSGGTNLCQFGFMGSGDALSKFFVGPAWNSTWMSLTATEARFNDHGADRDFRIESGANTHAFFLEGSTGKVGIGAVTPLGRLHVDQSAAGGAMPVLVLDQADLSEEFIELKATVGAGNPIDTAAIGTYYGKMRVSVTGVGYKYIALYNS